MKRFTATEKWDDPWFWELSPQAKLLWMFLCDQCDHAGIIDLSLKMASVKIGLTITAKHLDEVKSRISKIDCGKYFIIGFIKFQFGKLSRECKPHSPVFASLEKHGVDPMQVDQNERFKNVVDDSTREKVIERDKCSCVYTGKQLLPDEAVVDHVIPRIKGGSNNLINLVTTSKEINSEKWDKDLRDYCLEKGWDFNDVSQRVSKATTVGCQTLQDKEKDKDKDKSKEKEGVQGEKNTAVEFLTTDIAQAAVIYEAYPRKVGKPDALKSIKKALNKVPPDQLLVKTKLYAAARAGQDAQFTPHPATWFNQERYNDDPSTWNQSSTNGHSVFDIKSVIEAKTKLAQDLKNKHASEGPLTTDWTDPRHRDSYVALRKEIKDLTTKLGEMM